MKTIAINRIRAKRSYSVKEAADVLRAHPRTIQAWIKSGLRILDGSRPFLIMGGDLKSFLAKRIQNRKQALGPDEFYCFRCKTRVTASGVSTIPGRAIGLGKISLRLKGSCVACGCPVNKFSAVTVVPIEASATYGLIDDLAYEVRKGANREAAGLIRELPVGPGLKSAGVSARTEAPPVSPPAAQPGPARTGSDVPRQSPPSPQCPSAQAAPQGPGEEWIDDPHPATLKQCNRASGRFQAPHAEEKVAAEAGKKINGGR
jgi:hypothetical protein